MRTQFHRNEVDLKVTPLRKDSIPSESSGSDESTNGSSETQSDSDVTNIQQSPALSSDNEELLTDFIINSSKDRSHRPEDPEG